MANSNFIVQNGLQVGPLTIDAATGSITTSGNVNITGNLGVSQISKNDSSISINDNGTSSNVSIIIDGANETTIDSAGLKLPSGDAFYINGASVLNATTLGSGVTASSLTSVGTLTGLTLSGTLTGTTVNAATIGNTGAIHTGATGTFTGTVTANAINAATIGNSGATLTGTLSTAAQPNVTSLGTLTGLTTSGTVTAATVNAATIGNSGAALSGSTLGLSSTLNVTGAATLNSLSVNADAVIGGNLTVNGTTTTINVDTVTVEDKNITLANVASPTNTTADGGGITVKGATDKTFNWVNATAAWTSSEDVNLVSGKVYEINGATVLSATTLGSGVTASSLTSVGTIGTGVWQGTVVGATYGGTGVNNGSNTLTLGASVNINQNLRTSDAPTFAGLTTSAAIVPNANASVNLGSTSAWYNNVYGVTFVGVSTTAKYADLAENYAADAEYEPGTVVCFGGDAEVTVCNVDHCQKVAGVVSTDPAYLMNSGLEGTKAAVALQGRVPCKVVGAVQKGDMMVAAGNGRARAESNPKIGAVIGKALENFDGTDGVIEVVIGRV